MQREAAPDVPVWEHLTPQQKAQQLADNAAKATTRLEVEGIDKLAEAERLGDDHICTNREEDIWEELRSYLRDRWRSLPAGEAQ